ncbi:MAG: alpha-L-rhamnosidase N-terminal domain-containing protein [Bryobacteraceae bacterium]
MGPYEMFINGQRVGHDVLTSGFTDFTKRMQYQTYDVIGLPKDGQNAMAQSLEWAGSAAACPEQPKISSWLRRRAFLLDQRSGRSE